MSATIERDEVPAEVAEAVSRLAALTCKPLDDRLAAGVPDEFKEAARRVKVRRDIFEQTILNACGNQIISQDLWFRLLDGDRSRSSVEIKCKPDSIHE